MTPATATRRKRAAFVSTTQAFDTSTSLGRMTVNLLATFATFEREMISERTADKVCAARKRGLWTGGIVSLGYDLVDKRLVVNPEEAERVRAIFQLPVSSYLSRSVRDSDILSPLSRLLRSSISTNSIPGGLIPG